MNKMKRYYAFIGMDYYPDGGMGDFLDDFDNIDDAKKAITEESEKEFNNYESKQSQIDYFWEYNWAHIWDSQERKEIWYKENKH